MPGPKATPVSVTVTLSLDLHETTGSGAWHCPTCQSDLDLSQPSAQNPDLLLGTCPSCDAWFLFYQDATTPHCRVLRLPTATELHSAAATTPRATSPRGPRRG